MCDFDKKLAQNGVLEKKCLSYWITSATTYCQKIRKATRFINDSLSCIYFTLQANANEITTFVKAVIKV